MPLFRMAPAAFLTDFGGVYVMGADKYGEKNWRKGYPWSWSINAMLRHQAAMIRGEWRDTESGLPHVAHVAWHCATLHEFERLGLGVDDRCFDVTVGDAPALMATCRLCGEPLTWDGVAWCDDGRAGAQRICTEAVGDDVDHEPLV